MTSIGSGSSDDAACWQEAVRLYNMRLKNGSSNKKYIRVGTLDDGGDDSKNHARELMDAAMGSYQKLAKKRGLFAMALIKIVTDLLYNNIGERTGS
ncbi:hypothetical protein F4777DRAFT_583707 [Nemania sp. FL0916]|nr:hypothetical protein F4777DRAFT_583707 [Nemania sp. FL0916]